MLNRLPRLQRKLSVLIFLATLTISAAFAARTLAQATGSPWQPPANISQSGAASQAQLAVAPDGTVHAVWWDAETGEQYSYTTDAGGTTWSKPTTMPAIYGKREEDTQTKRVSITPPRDVRLVSSTNGPLHVFWLNDDNELYSMERRADGWGEPIRLAESASIIDVSADPNGGLHLAYARPIDTAAAPAGLYYLTSRNGNWTAPALVYASPYYRTIKPQNVYLSVAGTGAGQAMVAWDAPQLGYSVFARSTNDGATWTAPETVTGSAGLSKQARVASTPTGELLLIWQDPGSGGCGYTQRRSQDGGATWTAPEKVLGALTQCDLTWTFMPANGRLWLAGRSKSQAENLISEVMLTMWDGAQWSTPTPVSLAFLDPVTNRTISLSCLDVYLNGETAALLGCDPANDLWVARNNVALKELIPQLQPVWSPPIPLSDRNVPAAGEDLPALTHNQQGTAFALWSQDIAGSDSHSALYASAADSAHWTRTAQVLESPEIGGADKAIQPALTIDPDGKAHAVWSSGSNGRIYYSWTYLRDFTSASAWAQPIALSSPGVLSSWPVIVADPRDAHLYATYAVPLNEKRGIYLARSLDDGASWITPTVILDAVAAKWDSVDFPRIALDPVGDTLHVVWLRKLPPGGAGNQEVYYVRSTDQGQTWSTPLLIAKGNVDWPQIAVGGPNQVYIAWNEYVTPRRPDSATPMTVWGQFSPDGGQRWSTPLNIRSLKQVSGPIGLTSNGNGRFYIAAIGKGSGEESTLFNVEWNGQDWEERPALGLQQQATTGNAAVITVAPNQGQLTVMLRHRLWNPDGSTQASIDATGRAVPIESVAAVPTFTPQPTLVAQATPTIQPTATPRPKINSSRGVSTSDSGGLNPFALGGLLAAIVVIAIVGRIIWLRRM